MFGHIDASRIQDAYHVLDTFSSYGGIIARTMHIYVQFGPNYIHTRDLLMLFIHAHALSISSSISLHNLHIAHCTLHMYRVIFRCFTIHDSRKLSSSISVSRLCLPVYMRCTVCSLQFAVCNANM